MTRMEAAAGRLRRAGDLGAVLGAAYEAFEVMRVVVRAREDPASGLFAAFVMAAALAADGRDAIAFAPSMPPRGPGVPGAGGVLAGTAEEVARGVAGLSGLVAVRLGQVAGQAEPGDREACQRAASCARGIGELLGGGGP
jgi:hypothetical protein